MGSAPDWPQFFCEAISSLGERLPAAMEARGCREAWLQTEIMLYGGRRRISIWPNEEPVPEEDGSRRQKYDLAAYDARDKAVMAAEIKIMAGHFRQGAKCLTGTGRWQDYAVEGDERRIVTTREINACTAAWGLIPDARRLLRFRGERYLILILLDLETDGDMTDTARRSCTDLHHAMDGVTFGYGETTTPKPVEGCRVKVWSLHPPPRTVQR